MVSQAGLPFVYELMQVFRAKRKEHNSGSFRTRPLQTQLIVQAHK